MIVTQTSDPRSDWWLLSSYTLRTRKEPFHVMSRFASRKEAEAAREAILATSTIMIGEDVDAMRKLVVDRGYGVEAWAATATAADLRFVLPPRFDVEIMRLSRASGE